MGSLNLNANASAISIALIFRAMGLAIITVPLTTLAVSSLKSVDIPQGAALNNMMRQLGGSFGLAFVNTFMHIRSAEHRSDLVSHLTTENPLAIHRLTDYTHYFISKGANTSQAHLEAIQALENMVNKQSTQLSFSDAYLIIGAIFLISLPLITFAVKKKGEKLTVILTDH
jgi:DHA2 family multidrug resistance protein